MAYQNEPPESWLVQALNPLKLYSTSPIDRKTFFVGFLMHSFLVLDCILIRNWMALV